MNIPVVLIMYRRMDTVEEQMNILNQIKPSVLYLVGDDAPFGEEELHQKVLQIREYCEKAVQWSCDLRRIYAEENMGCDKRIETALSQVFREVGEAIILEDDCIPDPTFFEFCQQMLVRYRDDKRIMFISGGHYCPWEEEDTSYIFSRRGDIWGWATWADRWTCMEQDFFAEWKRMLDEHLVAKHYGRKVERALIRENGKYGLKPPWDIKWIDYTMASGRLAIVPGRNMVTNIGFDTNATHTNVAPDFSLKKNPMVFPMTEPDEVKPNKRYDTTRQRENFAISYYTRVKRRIKRFLLWIRRGQGE